MIRRLLISEQERQSILKSYGLLSEGVGDDYLVLPNYSVKNVLSFTVAVKNGGYNNISEFKKNCINTDSIPLSKKEKKILLLKLNDKWDVLADKCIKATPNKVYLEYQKNEEIKKKWTTLNPTLKKLAQDYIGYKGRKYCPNFSIEFAENKSFQCNINNKDFGLFQNYDEGGNLTSITTFLYGIIARSSNPHSLSNEVLTQESIKKINEFINSQSGGLVGLSPIAIDGKMSIERREDEIKLNPFNVKNYDDIKKLYEILENLSSKSEEIKSLVVIESDNKWVNFLNKTDNKKYCSNLVEDITGVNCSFDITKKNELGKFEINWVISPDNMNKINIENLEYNLTEEEKTQTTKEKIAAYFVKNIPKGFEKMVSPFDPFFIESKNHTSIKSGKLSFFTLGIDVTFDKIKLLYEYVMKMDQGVKNKEYLNS